MTDEDLINEINSLIAALQTYARVAGDLNRNIGRPVEKLMQLLLEATEGTTLVNANFSAPNAVAIDLEDMHRPIAYQITTNANTKKWRKTLDSLQNNKLLGPGCKYQEVRVIGFCSAVNVTAKHNVPQGFLVQGLEGYLQRLSYLPTPVLQHVVQELRRSYDFSRLVPMADEHCFAHLHRLMNRDALRHPPYAEGSFEAQARALQDIKAAMFGGARGALRGKGYSEYADDAYRTLFDEIDLLLGNMLKEIGAIRRANGQPSTFSSQQSLQEFDASRLKVIAAVNGFCKSKNLQLAEIVSM